MHQTVPAYGQNGNDKTISIRQINKNFLPVPPCLHIPGLYYPARAACIVLPCLLAQGWLAVRLQLLLHFDTSICCCNSRADCVYANIVSHDVIQSFHYSVLRMTSWCL